MNNVGLVLEGGGMRGVYTGGVLEYFQEQELYFPYVIGVSAGACNGASYISRQIGRNEKVTIDLVDNPNYLSYKNLFLKRQLFGMDFIFEEIPNKVVPFDYDTFQKTPERFVIGTTDCHTGNTIYYEKKELIDKDISTVLKASSSLPLMAPVVSFKGMDLLDGGISDPIPVKKSIQDGNNKNVVILTRNSGYRKRKSRLTSFLHRPYKQYPNLIEKMKSRHEEYNSTLQFIEEEEKKGHLFVIRPSMPLKVGRIERDKKKLTDLFKLGYEDAKQQSSYLDKWLQG